MEAAAGPVYLSWCYPRDGGVGYIGGHSAPQYSPYVMRGAKKKYRNYGPQQPAPHQPWHKGSHRHDRRGGQAAWHPYRSTHHLRHGRIERNHFVPDWDLDGLSEKVKPLIDQGYAHYTWTPFPLGLRVAEIILNNLRFLDPECGGDEHTRHRIVSKSRILHATAGAGGSTIALSQVFYDVTAGDFCPMQLKALRTNTKLVPGVGEVRIDDGPINALDRTDYNEFDVVVLEPCWGGIKYQEAPFGTYELYLNPGEFKEEYFDGLPHGGEEAYAHGAPVVIMPSREADEGDDLKPVSLASHVQRVLEENDRVKVVSCLLPWNADIRGTVSTLAAQGGLSVFLWHPMLHSNGIFVPNLRTGDVGGHFRESLQKKLDEIYEKYSGPDVYLFVRRCKDISAATMGWAEWTSARPIGLYKRIIAWRPPPRRRGPGERRHPPWWRGASGVHQGVALGGDPVFLSMDGNHYESVQKAMNDLGRNDNQGENSSGGDEDDSDEDDPRYVAGANGRLYDRNTGLDQYGFDVNGADERGFDKNGNRVYNSDDDEDDNWDDDDEYATRFDEQNPNAELLDGEEFYRYSRRGNMVYKGGDDMPEFHFARNGARIVKASDGTYRQVSTGSWIEVMQRARAEFMGGNRGGRRRGGGGGGGAARWGGGGGGEGPTGWVRGGGGGGGGGAVGGGGVVGGGGGQDFGGEPGASGGGREVEGGRGGRASGSRPAEHVEGAKNKHKSVAASGGSKKASVAPDQPGKVPGAAGKKKKSKHGDARAHGGSQGEDAQEMSRRLVSKLAGDIESFRLYSYGEAHEMSDAMVERDSNPELPPPKISLHTITKWKKIQELFNECKKEASPYDLLDAIEGAIRSIEVKREEFRTEHEQKKSEQENPYVANQVLEVYDSLLTNLRAFTETVKYHMREDLTPDQMIFKIDYVQGKIVKIYKEKIESGELARGGSIQNDEEIRRNKELLIRCMVDLTLETEDPVEWNTNKFDNDDFRRLMEDVNKEYDKKIRQIDDQLFEERLNEAMRREPYDAVCMAAKRLKQFIDKGAEVDDIKKLRISIAMLVWKAELGRMAKSNQELPIEKILKDNINPPKRRGMEEGKKRMIDESVELITLIVSVGRTKYRDIVPQPAMGADESKAVEAMIIDIINDKKKLTNALEKFHGGHGAGDTENAGNMDEHGGGKKWKGVQGSSSHIEHLKKERLKRAMEDLIERSPVIVMERRAQRHAQVCSMIQEGDDWGDRMNRAANGTTNPEDMRRNAGDRANHGKSIDDTRISHPRQNPNVLIKTGKIRGDKASHNKISGTMISQSDAWEMWKNVNGEAMIRSRNSDFSFWVPSNILGDFTSNTPIRMEMEMYDKKNRDKKFQDLGGWGDMEDEEEAGAGGNNEFPVVMEIVDIDWNKLDEELMKQYLIQKGVRVNRPKNPPWNYQASRLAASSHTVPIHLLIHARFGELGNHIVHCIA